MVSLNITVLGEEQLSAKIDDYTGKIKDLKPVWARIEEEIKDIETGWFESEGGGSWVPLSPKYAIWKAMNFGSLPLLVLSGDMKSAFTGNGVHVTRGRYNATVKFSGPRYWQFHQTGTRKMPQRKVVALEEEEAQDRLLRILRESLIRHLPK